MTSQKKRDTMIPYTNTSIGTPQGNSSYSSQPAVIGAGYTVFNPFVWCATARDNTINSTLVPGSKFTLATRTATACYMRGLKETVEIQTSSGLPWQWRRICFTAKGFHNRVTNATGFSLGLETSNGWARVVNEIPDNARRDLLEEVIFKGKKFVDWFDQITAPTDNSRVTIKYDKVRHIAAGNEEGCIRRYPMWHGMNKTLVYDDDETGGTEQVSSFSTIGKAGMGDYYVVDFFIPRIGGTSADQLTFTPQATLYWHEK